MKSNVVVTADKAGNVISVSKNNPEWGHIRVEQTRMEIDENGFARATTYSALIPGEVKKLAAFGFSAGQVLPGTIYVKEQTNAFDTKVNPERDLKVAGKTGIICRLGDQSIYRKNFYHDQADKCDETIVHTNGDEITAAYAALKTSSAIAPNTEFSA